MCVRDPFYLPGKMTSVAISRSGLFLSLFMLKKLHLAGWKATHGTLSRGDTLSLGKQKMYRHPFAITETLQLSQMF